MNQQHHKMQDKNQYFVFQSNWSESSSSSFFFFIYRDIAFHRWLAKLILRTFLWKLSHLHPCSESSLVLTFIRNKLIKHLQRFSPAIIISAITTWQKKGRLWYFCTGSHDIKFDTVDLLSSIYIQDVFFHCYPPKNSKCLPVSKFWYLELSMGFTM